MEFQFDATQPHQIQAIRSVVDLFKGQHSLPSESIAQMQFGNHLDLTPDALLENLQAVQAENGIASDAQLENITESYSGGSVTYYNFSVEMETGTGKTYVYLRTALELFRQTGWRKFIIVVPSVAIREGVLKTLEVTKKHFAQLYKNLPYRFYAYEGTRLSQVRQFVESNQLEFMVITVDAFNKASNVLRRSTDELQGETPIHLLQGIRPILILDEPQTKLEGKHNSSALAELNPLLTLRYSATHRHVYNLVYRLSPFEAYRQKLVKHIEVASITQADDFNRAFIEVVSISSTKHTMQAKLRLHKQQKNGVKQVILTVKPGDNLYKKTHMPDYKDYVLEGIEDDRVYFWAGNQTIEVCEGQSTGDDKDAVFAGQIAFAIQEHFAKQSRLQAHGIKVLTLFFIDKVANYQTEQGEAGIIRRLFDQHFDSLKGNYPEWKTKQAQAVQKAYFAKKSSGILDDSTTGTAQKDQEAYNLIMRDKERLLSFDEPTAFIFSHSALNEGWDNPNIFQICVLRDVGSVISKRQQIGRGVRLAVNQQGTRIQNDTRINKLTVIANESYTEFVKSYQEEIETVYGKGTPIPTIGNQAQKIQVNRNKRYELSEDFKELWERIKHKTRYAVTLNTEDIVKDIASKLAIIGIKAPRITAVTAGIQLDKHADQFSPVVKTGAKTLSTLERKGTLADLIKRLESLLEFQSTPLAISRKTILMILQESGQIENALTNPHDFATQASQLIRETLAEYLVDGIQYERIDEWYEMTLFESEWSSYKDHLIPAEKSIYDQVAYDSEVEKEFVRGMDAREDVLLYIKLPSWFLVPTPVGNYNPDWAIVLQDDNEPTGSKLYLVRETKGVGEMRPTEKYKTECGKVHFQRALGVSYKIVNSANQLP